MTDALTRVTDPAYIEGLAAEDIDDIREKRQECQDLENSLSYVRRLIHGRLDIVRSELERRRAGNDPADLAGLIDRLPELLAEGSRSDSLPRPPQDLAPDSDAERLAAELEAAVPASQMGELPELSLDEVAAMGDALAEHERRISGGRGALHDVIDALSAEIIRRYQAGDANVDSLLH